MTFFFNAMKKTAMTCSIRNETVTAMHALFRQHAGN